MNRKPKSRARQQPTNDAFDHSNRAPIFIQQYDDQTKNLIKQQLPVRIEQAEIRAIQTTKPSLAEKNKIRAILLEFITRKNRIVYGGTSMNEAIKTKSPKDAFYTDVLFSDIEFYTDKPWYDIRELKDVLESHNIVKRVEFRPAIHDETFNLFINYALYMDITYVPRQIFNKIPTFTFDGSLTRYTTPHFAIIDLERMINDPINAAKQRWEKAFGRMYLLLKYYPYQFTDKSFVPVKNVEESDVAYEKSTSSQHRHASSMDRSERGNHDDYKDRRGKSKLTGSSQDSSSSQPSTSASTIIDNANDLKVIYKHIKTHFLTTPDNVDTCLITGAHAYNFFITNTYHDNPTLLNKLTYDYSEIELLSNDYANTVVNMYNYLKSIFKNPEKIGLVEYVPFFQFINKSAVFTFNNVRIVSVYNASGYCIPFIRSNKEYKYVSYQYLLMTLKQLEFREYVRVNRDKRRNYKIMVSNLLTARNRFNKKHNLTPLSQGSIFEEFKVDCVGKTIGYFRTSKLRKELKDVPFKNVPYIIANLDNDNTKKLQMFKNTSGNRATSKCKSFDIDLDTLEITKLYPDNEINDTISEELDTDVSSTRDIEDADMLSSSCESNNTANYSDSDDSDLSDYDAVANDDEANDDLDTPMINPTIANCPTNKCMVSLYDIEHESDDDLNSSQINTPTANISHVTKSDQAVLEDYIGVIEDDDDEMI